MRHVQLLPLLLAGSLSAQGAPYGTSPVWTSYSTGVATGGELVDLDRDGDLDLVVANGNDILRQRIDVFSNDGSGGFPTSPQWSSSDVDYHGHLSAGDVDQDGWCDLAVSVFLGAGGFGTTGHVKLYRNLAGTLESTPSWRSAGSAYTFSCDLGDADGDGDLDLAVATGEPYFGTPSPNLVFYNAGGALATTPGWTQAFADHALDVAWGDADGDGDLDLAVATAAGPPRVFYQGAGGLATSAGWTASDTTSQFGNTAAWWDTDGDGFLELAMTDNDQLSGGAGLFKLYDNVGGTLGATPAWSDFGGQVSAIAFADYDLDGFAELAGGIWFAGAQAYDNVGGSLAAAPHWSGAVGGTVEALAFGDVDGDGLVLESGEAHAASGGRTFYLDHAPLQEVLSVTVDGVPLPRTGWSCDRADGWVALDRTPVTDVVVAYRWSRSLDLFVTNWDQSVGNQLHLRALPPGVASRNGSGLNPLTLTSVTLPFVGSSWTARLDCGGHAPSFAVLQGQSAPLSGVFLAAGELLVDLFGGVSYFQAVRVHGGGPVGFALPVPNDVALVGLVVHTQGACLGAPGLALSNALDATLGR